MNSQAITHDPRLYLKSTVTDTQATVADMVDMQELEISLAIQEILDIARLLAMEVGMPAEADMPAAVGMAEAIDKTEPDPRESPDIFKLSY